MNDRGIGFLGLGTMGAAMAANLGPATDHRIIPGQGHTIMTTDPKLLASIINEFQSA